LCFRLCATAVDEVTRCCDRACSGVACERCSLDGTCGAVPPFATECSEVVCPSDDVCRDFDQAIVAGTCAEGRCATAADCAFEWTGAARSGQACECDATGCALSVTEACTRDDDCASGGCRATAAGANVCCAQACAAGQVCRTDGSGCELEPVCTNGQVRCSSTSYQRCVGGQWATERECGALGCDVALEGCRRSAGQACNSSAECGEGACRETANGARVCCTAACDTACRVCTAAGTACQFLPDDAACGTISCPGDSTCRDYPNSVSANRCRAGSCGAPADLCSFTSRNEGQSCSGTSLCDGAGDCSVQKGALGATCSSNIECLSGQCVDGVCCESACNGPCMACNSGTGRCDVMPADDNACPVVACDDGPECSQASPITTRRCQAVGQCKDSRQCSPMPSPRGTACDQELSTIRLCNGSGSCVDPTVSCGASSCAINEDTVCCHAQNANGVLTPSCVAPANCPFGPTGGVGMSRVFCDNDNDCRTGNACCLSFSSSSSVNCLAPSSCRDTVGSSAGKLCSTPTFSSSCVAPSSCSRTNARFPGWVFCS
jgi:hypothetical protein